MPHPLRPGPAGHPRQPRPARALPSRTRRLQTPAAGATGAELPTPRRAPSPARVARPATQSRRPAGGLGGGEGAGCRWGRLGRDQAGGGMPVCFSHHRGGGGTRPAGPACPRCSRPSAGPLPGRAHAWYPAPAPTPRTAREGPARRPHRPAPAAAARGPGGGVGRTGDVAPAAAERSTLI
jgi:hypothetical protein